MDDEQIDDDDNGNDPTPEQIRRLCYEIRKDWSPNEFMKRRVAEVEPEDE